MATNKYDQYNPNQRHRTLTAVLCCAIISFLFSAYVLHFAAQYKTPALWLQALTILLMWLTASTSIYHSQRYLLPTLTAALVTLSSASNYAYAKYGLDMPGEFAIAMGVAVSSLFTAMILFLASQQQVSES
ncbi:hypothetical protein [Sinobacterium norvegicum]|uniref:hypothetical protein n=1 Tax=Sinobacterium norvegicum TaxID=1641715 RepID=UPI001F45544F|nr:hypothetical protein [Sinobacterium norvegicum]